MGGGTWCLVSWQPGRWVNRHRASHAMGTHGNARDRNASPRPAPAAYRYRTVPLVCVCVYVRVVVVAALVYIVGFISLGRYTRLPPPSFALLSPTGSSMQASS